MDDVSTYQVTRAVAFGGNIVRWRWTAYNRSDAQPLAKPSTPYLQMFKSPPDALIDLIDKVLFVLLSTY